MNVVYKSHVTSFKSEQQQLTSVKFYVSFPFSNYLHFNLFHCIKRTRGTKLKIEWFQKYGKVSLVKDDETFKKNS
jgi:hypothetical protein